MHPTYSLATTTHSCAFRRSVILLDIAGDRYLRIAGPQLGWFREIAGGPGHGSQAALYAGHLERAGLIVEGRGGRPLDGPGLQADEPMLALPALDGVSASRATELWRFFLSLYTAHRMRRRKCLSAQLALAAAWKARAEAAFSPRVAACAATFHAIAPFFFSTHDACFVRSLALLNYLFRYGYAADWIFGVRDTPFEAHCWLESGPFILNDAPDHVASFSRILKV